MAEEVQRDGREPFPAGHFPRGGPTHAVGHRHQQPRLAHLQRTGGRIDDGLFAIQRTQQVGIFVVPPDFARMGDRSEIDEHEK